MALVVKPTTYQINALSSLEQSKQNKALTVLPSGSGKTYLAAFNCKAVGAKTILYIVHRNEILEQSKKIFCQVLGLKDSDIGIVNGNLKQFNKNIIFASILTLANPESIKKIIDRRFDYVIIDEFHHVAASSYQIVLESLQYGFLHGLTATPYRLDGKDITAYVDKNIIYSRNLQEAIKDGELVPFLYNGLWDDVDYSNIKWRGYNYRENDLNRALLIDTRDKAIIKNFKELIGKGTRQTIGFCVSVKHAERMAAKFNEAGIPSMAITWKTDYLERRSLITLFRQKHYQVVFTRDIFNEGIDFPEVEALLFLRPTVSKTVFYQQIGRGLRKAPNKKNVIALDFIGNYNNAWHIRQWLEFARESKEPLGHREKKPEYHHNLASVHFDKKVIDLFEEQAVRSIPATQEAIIDQFKKMHEYTGRWLNTQDWHRLREYKEFSYLFHPSKIYRYFKTWNDLYIAVGYQPFKNPPGFWRYHDEGLMIDNYREVKARLMQQYGNDEARVMRTIKEYMKDSRNTRFSSDNYGHKWHGWYKFLTAIDEPTHYKPLGLSHKKEESKKELVKMYNELSIKLGRQYISGLDWRREYGKRGWNLIYRRFGNILEFRKFMNGGNEIPNRSICKYCNNGFNARFASGPLREYCSTKCANKWNYIHSPYFIKKREQKARNLKLKYPNGLPTNCQTCGAGLIQVKNPRNWYAVRRFCSKRCQSLAAMYNRGVGRRSKTGKLRKTLDDALNSVKYKEKIKRKKREYMKVYTQRSEYKQRTKERRQQFMKDSEYREHKNRLARERYLRNKSKK